MHAASMGDDGADCVGLLAESPDEERTAGVESDDEVTHLHDALTCRELFLFAVVELLLLVNVLLTDWRRLGEFMTQSKGLEVD
jgi:hypothetical protein